MHEIKQASWSLVEYLMFLIEVLNHLVLNGRGRDRSEENME